MWSGTKTTSANSHPVNCSLYNDNIIVVSFYYYIHTMSCTAVKCLQIIPHGINNHYVIGVLWVHCIPLVNVGGAMTLYTIIL